MSSDVHVGHSGSTGRACVECSEPLAGRQQMYCSGICKKRYNRRDPAYAERDRQAARRWKEQHREENRARDRQFGRQQRIPCPECGGPMCHDKTLCLDCRRRSKQARLERMAELWQGGYSHAEIAAEVGSTPGAVSVAVTQARNAGSTAFPYRRRDKVAA